MNTKTTICAAVLLIAIMLTLAALNFHRHSYWIAAADVLVAAINISTIRNSLRINALRKRNTYLD